MTERINVEAKTQLNRAHAVIALIFWIGIGIAAFVADFDYAMAVLIAGIIIGIVRLFVINDKYAWQVATIEEIREIKEMLEQKGFTDVSKAEVKKDISQDKDEKSIKDQYEIIDYEGKKLAIVKGGNKDNFYCPECYSQVNPKSKSCYKCGKDF